ncbi:hypothetical protein OSTOST_08325, partial [Ostertagia ostertagi]
ITDFCKFTEEVLSAVKEDSELIEVINALDTAESFDSLTGSNLIDHLVGRLSHSGVAEWIQKADKPWCLRHICSAFPHWSNEARVEVLTNLLQRPKSQEIQYAVGNCIDSMFKMKVRAGELVNVSLVEGGEDVLRQTVTAIFGKDVVKSGLKKMKSCEYAKSALPVFWMCLKLWSKMASSDEVSEGYTSNAEELVMVAKGDEDGLKVLLDQLLAHLSQPLKYHRTVVYYVFVQLLPHFKKEHVSHIIETMMMDDEELADEQGSEGESTNDEDEGGCYASYCFVVLKNMDDGEAAGESESESLEDEEGVDPEALNRLESALGKAAVKRKGDAIDEEETMMMDDEELADEQGSEGESTNDEDEGGCYASYCFVVLKNMDDGEAAGESESESLEDEEGVDPEALNRLESALGKAAVKRKGDAIDEEESDASDVDDAEMFALDDRLAAAFKAMAPKKSENKMATQLASAFRLKLADLLLFTISSQDTPASIKIHMIVPLLKLAKLQLKQDTEGLNSRKTISLLNILSRLKKIEVADKQVISLLNKLIAEGSGISNPTFISTVAALCSFIVSLNCLVLAAFDIGSFLMNHLFRKRACFSKPGSMRKYRVFRRTEALLCLAGMMNKGVLLKAPVEKSIIKGIAKASSEYLRASIAEPETIKPRFFASVLRLLLSTANSIGDDLKPTLQKHLKLDAVLEDEQTLSQVSKKINSACQQVCGKSATRVLDAIQKA